MSKNKYFAGIGSRESPDDILELMNKTCKYLAAKGWILRSGGADGADFWCEKGCNAAAGKKEIFLPWQHFNYNESPLYEQSDGAFEIAAKFHPAWDKLKESVRKLMARNVLQVLGADLKTPVSFVLAWTKDGQATGGTGQALRIAAAYNIPIRNLYYEEVRKKIVETIDKKQKV